MIKLEINDKIYNIPESFEEMSMEQYCRIFYHLPSYDGDDDIERFRHERQVESVILSRILGEDDEFCLSLPLNVYAQLNESVRYLYDIDSLLSVTSSRLLIDGRYYSIPPFEEMSLRQYIDADVIIQGKENPLQYIELLSILLTSKDDNGNWIPYDGEYHGLMERLRSLKCSDGLPLVYHFFLLGETLKKLSKVSMRVEEVRHRLHTANS